jgi:hypothetical protein
MLGIRPAHCFFLLLFCPAAGPSPRVRPDAPRAPNPRAQINGVHGCVGDRSTGPCTAADSLWGRCWLRYRLNIYVGATDWLFTSAVARACALPLAWRPWRLLAPGPASAAAVKQCGSNADQSGRRRKSWERLPSAVQRKHHRLHTALRQHHLHHHFAPDYIELHYCRLMTL